RRTPGRLLADPGGGSVRGPHRGRDQRGPQEHGRRAGPGSAGRAPLGQGRPLAGDAAVLTGPPVDHAGPVDEGGNGEVPSGRTGFRYAMTPRWRLVRSAGFTAVGLALLGMAATAPDAVGVVLALVVV